MSDTKPVVDLSPIERPEEAERRANDFSNDDPFEEVQPSLLSRVDIKRYVLATGMLFPFDEARLKTASYEMRPGERFIYWEKIDGKTRKVDKEIGKDTRYLTLPANSISYIQVENEFRLPLYIALRFNLRITHVHRGILLGTGPLVDPGFRGKLLIPLHNLTATDYELDLHNKKEDGLIWVEFTKTTYKKATDPDLKLDPHMQRKRPEDYLRKANGGNAILSSIHDAVQSAQIRAEEASRTVKIVSGVGILAIFGILVGLTSMFQSTSSLVQGASAHVSAAQSAQVSIEKDIGDMKERILTLSTQLKSEEALTAKLQQQLAIQKSNNSNGGRPGHNVSP